MALAAFWTRPTPVLVLAMLAAYAVRMFGVTAGYHRYTMHGLDDTVQAMFPQANVYTVGVSVLW